MVVNDLMIKKVNRLLSKTIKRLLKSKRRIAKEFLLWGTAVLASFVLLSILSPVQRIFAAISPLGSSGVMFYGDSASAGTLRARVFTSTATWATEISGVAAGSASNIMHVTAKTSPTREEMMIGELKVDGRLNVQTCTTGCDTTGSGDFTSRFSATFVSATQDCDTTPTTGTCVKPFDIAYQARNGKAMVVYAGDSDANSATDTDVVYYAEWDGSAWAPDTTPASPSTSNDIPLPGTAGNPEWVRVIPEGDGLDGVRSDRLMLLLSDSNDDLFAFYWDGSTWDGGTTLETALEGNTVGRPLDGAWSQNSSGTSVFVAAYTETEGTPENDIEYQTYTVGTGWSGESQAFTTSSASQWVQAANDPTSTRVYVTTADGGGDDTYGAVWRAGGSDGWTVCANGDPNCPELTLETVGPQQASTSFERFSGQALHVFNNAGTTDTDNYYTYAPTSTWGNETAGPMIADDDALGVWTWGHPNADDIMVAMWDIDCDLDAVEWAGSGFGANTELEIASSGRNVVDASCTAGAPADGMAAQPLDFAWKMYTPWQRNWRWTNGETDTASTPTTFLANEITAPTGITNGQNLRLRINYAERGRAISNTDARKKLQYTSGCNPNSALESSCTWTDVDDPSGSGFWRYLGEADITCTATDCDDNTTITGTVLTGTGTGSAGLGWGTWVADKDSATTTAMDHTAQSGADTVQEAEYVLEPNGATPGATYYFRMYNIDQETMLYTEEDADDCGASSNADCTYPSLSMLNTDQLNYRWRSDDGAENAGSSLVAQDTAYSGLVKNTNIRLRFLVNDTGGDAGNINYRLDWAARVGATCDTDETYAAVPDTATTEHFDMVTTTHYADAAASTNVATGAGVITDPSGTFTAGKLVESTSNSTGNINMTTDRFTEVEYAFQANNNGTASGNYCFRVSNAGTALLSYTRYAALQLISEGPTVDQVMRHGNWFNNGSEQSFFWAD